MGLAPVDLSTDLLTRLMREFEAPVDPWKVVAELLSEPTIGWAELLEDEKTVAVQRCLQAVTQAALDGGVELELPCP